MRQQHHHVALLSQPAQLLYSSKRLSELYVNAFVRMTLGYAQLT